MKNLYSSQQMREIDRYNEEELHISVEKLMLNAGESIAAVIFKKHKGGKIAVVCGHNNNGGDGFACAVVLNRQGVNADIFYIEGELKPAAEKYFKKCREIGLNLTPYKDQELKDYEIIIDAVLGTGVNRDLEGVFLNAVNNINNSNALIISADIPSGLNADYGLVMGAAVKPDSIVTFVGEKTGFYLNQGLDYCKDIIRNKIGAEISVQPKSLMYEDSDYYLPNRISFSHKGSYAKAAIIAGSYNYSGAAFFCAQSFLKSGGGLVTVAVPSDIKNAYLGQSFESMLLPLKSNNGHIQFDKKNLEKITSSDIIIFGSGLEACRGVKKTLNYLLENFTNTIIIDADGLNCLDLDKLKTKKCKTILTPHIGEFCRLFGYEKDEVLKNIIDLSKKCAQEYGTVIVLKSNSTVITDGDNTYLYGGGTPAQAKGGSGDILAGIIGSYCKFFDPLRAAVTACYTVGESAKEAQKKLSVHSVLPQDVISYIPKVVNDLIKE